MSGLLEILESRLLLSAAALKEDAYVSTKLPDFVFDGARGDGDGSARQSELHVAAGVPGVTDTRITYLVFEISRSPDIQSAHLVLNGSINPTDFITDPANITVDAHGVGDTSWDENTITFNNRPQVDSAVLASVVVTGQEEQQYVWDVTSYVKSQQSKGIVALALMGSTPVQTDDDEFFADFDSNRNVAPSSLWPSLQIESTPTPTPTPVDTPTPTPTATVVPPVAGSVAATIPLSIAAITPALPAVLVGGQKTARGTVSVQLTNTSTDMYSGTVIATITALPVGATDSSILLALGSIKKKLKLKVGATVTLKAKVAVPVPSPGARSYALVATTAGTGIYPAGIAASAASPLDVQTPLVTLQSNGATPKTLTLAFGKKIGLAVPILNAGNVAAKGKVSFSIYISTDNTTGGGLPVSVQTLNVGINPNATKTSKFKSFVIPPASIAQGSYNLVVTLTALDALGQLNTTNDAILTHVPFTIV